MISENQAKRLLLQARSAWKSQKAESVRGWIEALELVLEVNGPVVVRDTPLKKKEKNE